MEIITLIYIGIALIVGFLIGKVLFNRKFQARIAALNAEERKLADVQSELSSTQNELQGKIAALDAKERELADVQSALSSTQVELQGKSAALEEKERELADIQDDLEDVKCDLRRRKKELADVRNKLEDAENELTEVRKAKEQLKKISDDLEKKDSIKSKSLDFVKDILTAPKSNSAESDHSAKIDRIADYIKVNVKNALCSSFTVPKEKEDELFGSGLDRWAATARKSWLRGKISIAFVGEFSAGKTSIVNRLLSENNPDFIQLPVSTEATTAIPTYISDGKGAVYQFLTPNNELKHISSSIFERVSKDVLEQIKGVSSLIKYFIMTTVNPNLRRLSILDTPGFSSTDKEDAQRTISVINECDALFWVFDVNAGTINKTSIELIKQHLKKPLYIVINKVDTKSPSQVDDVEKHIKKALFEAGIKINGVIRFSIKSSLEKILIPVQSIAPDEQKDKYINRILTILKKHCDKQKNTRSEAIKKMNESDLNLQECMRKLKNNIRSIVDECKDVEKLPNKQSGFFNFKDPNYELTEESMDEMRKYLSSISRLANENLNKGIENCLRLHKEKQVAVDKYQEENDRYRKLQDCNEELMRLVNTLK